MMRNLAACLSVFLCLALCACGGGSKSFTNPPPPPVPTLTTITLTASTATVLVGTTESLQVSTKDQFGKPITVTLTFASNSSAATVDASGIVTGVSVGTATITVTATNGMSSSILLTIAPDPPVLTSIVLTPGNAQIAVGGSQQYSATGYDQYSNAMTGLAFTYSSGNINLVSVDSNGLATAVAPGMTSIGVSASGVSVTAGVTIVPPPPPPPPPPVLGSITLAPATITTLAIGSTETFTASAFDTTDKPMVVAFTYNSTSPTTASVDTGGTVTAMSAGSTSITASSGSVTSNISQVTVDPLPSILRLSPPIALVGSTFSVPLTITGTNFKAHDTTVNGFSVPLQPFTMTPNKLTVMIPPSEFAVAETVNVTVTTSDGTSNALPFYVTAQGFVSINFDDGYQSTYDNGLPIFDKAGMSYTWYIITQKPQPAPSYFANWMEIVSQAAKPNVEIGNHTRTHAGVPQADGTIKFLSLLGPTPTTLDSPDYGSPVVTDLPDETTGAQQDLIGMGVTPTTFAYPYGDYDYSPDPGNDPNSLPLSQQPVELAVQAAGMKGARTTNFCADSPSHLPQCGYVGGNASDKLPYALFAFEVNQNGNLTTLDIIKYWTTPALPASVGLYPTKTWTIITFHQVDEDQTVEVDSVDHTLLQGMVDYFIAQKIFVVTSDEGMTIMGLNGLN